MRVPFARRQYFIEPIRREHARDVAALHREDFARPWSADEFTALVDQDTVFGFVAREVARPADPIAGFVLARLAAGEAEILTVAVARAHRGAGLGRDLMDAVLRQLHAERAETLFLEVDETNAPALALYRRLGFAEVGRREGYYGGQGRARTAALVMRRDLR